MITLTSDLLVFGSRGQTDAARLDALDNLLASRILAAGRAHHLTDAQKAKLALAGCGDIKRFFDQVEAIRVDFADFGDSGAVAMIREDYALLQQAYLPFRTAYRLGPFGDGSLLPRRSARSNGESRTPAADGE